MPDYRHDPEFGVSIIPNASGLAEARQIARQAEALGFGLIGIQDHPYQWRFLDTWMLMATLLAETTRIRVFPDVANLPLRGPAMIAKQAASLDVADGWIPSLPYMPPERVPGAQKRIDDAAAEAGRDPSRIRRIYNVMGTIIDGPIRGLLQGPPAHWVEVLTSFVLELGFDTFIFWPVEDPIRQLERFAGEVVPGVRTAVARARPARVR